MYVKDDNLASFELMDFMNIFNHGMPFLTYKILGYKIKYYIETEKIEAYGVSGEIPE